MNTKDKKKTPVWLPAVALLIAWMFLTLLSSEGPVLFAKKTERNTQSIRWFNYEESVELAKKRGKKIFLTFYADWCSFCYKMDKETFRNPEVVAYLNANFIPSRVDTDKQVQIASQYNISQLPSTWFLAESGEVISSIPGYIDADRLIKILTFIRTNSYKKMTFRQFSERM